MGYQDSPGSGTGGIGQMLNLIRETSLKWTQEIIRGGWKRDPYHLMSGIGKIVITDPNRRISAGKNHQRQAQQRKLYIVSPVRT